MNLNFLINSFYGGGAEKQMLALLKRLEYKKAFTLEKEKPGPVRIGNHVPLSGHGPDTSNLIKFISLRGYARTLSGNLGRDDMLVSFMTRSNLVNVKASFKTGHLPVICERTNPSREFKGLRALLYRPLIKKTYPAAGLVVANSEGVKNCLGSDFGLSPDKIKVINNHVDNEKISHEMKEELGELDKIFRGPVLINSGRLTEAKAQWRLLKIFSHLKKTNPGTRLVILGDGELKDYLVSLSRGLGLKTFDIAKDYLSEYYDVYFLGFQRNPYKFLYRSKLFVFTSLWEGFPNALLEAMACRLPVFSANCEYGPAEILTLKPSISDYANQKPVNSDFGVLMPVLNGERINNAGEKLEEREKNWVESLSAFLGDYKKAQKYSELSVIRAADFDIEKICLKWKKLVEEAGK